MKWAIIIFLQLATFQSKAQRIFKYSHLNNPCELLINPDSTTVRVLKSSSNDLYIESNGRIRKINHSLYQIVDTSFFSLSIMENDVDPYSQFGVYVDTIFPRFKDIENILIQYADGTTNSIKLQKGEHIKYYYDKKKYNKKHPFIKIITNHSNPITKQPVKLTLFLRASLAFDSRFIESFQLQMLPNSTKMIGEPIITEVTH
ncbi:MAG: hypothetical protein IM584_06000 [Chitinophagaceae bacterium]|nr:hypothetical protein [Chitinophagaceae bacterium]MCA6454371.1 hypothetical protein [Chitinophagaceae bacterium]MCA6455671.1 hypothetical protein [Chitinophagaceae bacterium]MCA6457869.1 hypothetical protein [Chitinophagaceae bacterium]MCA6463582.1 hypothetical protein [Chitinophagaceae bacterium]